MVADILGIQIIGVLFGIFMVYYTFLKYKRAEFTVKEYSVWLGVWVVFVIVSIFSPFFKPVVEALGFVRTLDFLIILGFMFFTGISFYTYTLVRKNQRKLEDIVRRMAMEKK